MLVWIGKISLTNCTTTEKTLYKPSARAVMVKELSEKEETELVEAVKELDEEGVDL